MKEIFLVSAEIKNESRTANEIPAGVEMIGAPTFWGYGIQGEGVVIAILDTGCQADHPDLADNIIDGRNFTTDYDGDPENYSDNLYHGTHVAGTIASILNSSGVVGVAPKSKLLILKVLSGDSQGTYDNLIAGINYATQWRGPNGERVRIITMSLGGEKDNISLHQSIQNAVNMDILVVCASGNSGDGNLETDEIMYPGYYEEVVEVGAIDLDGNLASFSNTNDQVDLYAPGVNILSTSPNSQYKLLSGTSMAVPHVVGAAALIISHLESINNRTLTESEIFGELLKNTVLENHLRKLKLNI